MLYQFEGDKGPKGITGRFESIRAEPDTDEKPITTDSVVLEKLTLPEPNSQSGDLSGVYSNVRYNERSGDLNGHELILFRRGYELRGIFIKYEDMESLALENISLSGLTLSFRVVTLAGELTFSGTFSGNRIQVRRTDGNANPSLSSEVLLREGDVRFVFEKQTGSTDRYSVIKGLRLTSELVGDELFYREEAIIIKLKIENTGKSPVYIHTQPGLGPGGFRITISDANNSWVRPNFIRETFPTVVHGKADLRAIEPAKAIEEQLQILLDQYEIAPGDHTLEVAYVSPVTLRSLERV